MKNSRINLDNAEEINDHGILFEEARILEERSINIEYLKDCGDYIVFKSDELVDSCKAEYLDRMIERLIKYKYNKNNDLLIATLFCIGCYFLIVALCLIINLSRGGDAGCDTL